MLQTQRKISSVYSMLKKIVQEMTAMGAGTLKKTSKANRHGSTIVSVL